MTATHYTLLYAATLIVHVVFMNYVLGGTAYLAVRSLWRRGDGDPIVETARDWMPFALSAAITAGIAPLLFVQLVRQHAFYTANLLLFHRWMSIVPVLIVGFYLLYLMKSRPWHSRATPFLAIGSFLCIAWTGLSWTENHLLSLEAQSVWASFYESKTLWFRDPRVGLRFAVWLFGALPTFAVLIAWQLRFAQSRGAPSDAFTLGRLARFARVGLCTAVVTAGLYAVLNNTGSVDAFSWIPALAIVIVGGAWQWVAWRRLGRSAQPEKNNLWIPSGAVVTTMIGVTWLRQVLTSSAAVHQPGAPPDSVGRAGGIVVFAVFLVLSASLIAYSLWIATRPQRPTDGGPGNAT